MSEKKFNPNAYRSDLSRWANVQKLDMKTRVRMLTNGQKAEFARTFKFGAVRGIGKHERSQFLTLENSINSAVRSRMGYPERIVFPFLRYGFFLTHGYSRGHGKGNPREKKDWYSFVFGQRIENLSDIISKHQADQAVNISSRL